MSPHVKVDKTNGSFQIENPQPTFIALQIELCNSLDNDLLL